MRSRTMVAGTFAGLCLWACSSDERMAGGSGSETTNTIQVSVVDGSGLPVAQARVIARSVDDTTNSSAQEVRTDASGQAQLRDLGTQAWIEVRSGDSAGAFQSVPERHASRTTLVVARLADLVISGLEPGATASLPGLGRAMRAGSDGTARFQALPPGAARIRCTAFDGPVALPSGSEGKIALVDRSIETSWPADGSLDSLAVRRFLDLSGLADLKTDSVTSLIRGRRAHLGLSDLGLSRLHPSLGSLTFLRELMLEGNQLRTLPTNLGSIRELDVLDLKGNPLGSVPDALRDMDSLRILELDSCGLDSLPGWIGDLDRIWYLGVGNNRLQTLPPSFERLRRLGILSIFNNRLRTLPTGFHRLDSLSELWAASNQLEALPDSFHRLPSLSTLQLDGNPLKSLPDSIGRLGTLRDLRLTGTHLSTMPTSLSKVPLQRLDIQGLTLCGIDPALAPKLDSLAGTSWRPLAGTTCP